MPSHYTYMALHYEQLQEIAVETSKLVVGQLLIDKSNFTECDHGPNFV